MKPATPAEVDEIEKAITSHDNLMRDISNQEIWPVHPGIPDAPTFSTHDVAALVARIRQLERIVAGSH